MCIIDKQTTMFYYMLGLEKRRLDSKEKKENGPEPKQYREYPPASILDCCYVADADNVELTSPIDLESWKTLVSAAQIRNNQPVLDIVFNTNDEQLPSIFYHRKCRSLFTMKKALDRLRKENEEQSTEIVSSSSHVQESIYLPIKFDRH